MRGVCLVFCALVVAGFAHLEESSPQVYPGRWDIPASESPSDSAEPQHSGSHGPTYPGRWDPPASELSSDTAEPQHSENGEPPKIREPLVIPGRWGRLLATQDEQALNKTSAEVLDDLIKAVFGPNGDDYLSDETSEDDDDDDDEDDDDEDDDDDDDYDDDDDEEEEGEEEEEDGDEEDETTST
ncbi:hypothetical protein GE061_014615 [Apolygus lucorum]|uniref:Uncharacterized protein n=1 Tax=Apolygus lucorum TaxID=248454 RepID=A0A8S9XIP5_APOLU|nr:hypothetical protein GE061_014615 [Apolygus lucorum]